MKIIIKNAIYAIYFVYLGYELDTDKRTCKDIDECQIFGMCHQKCANVKGHYKCSCAKGYEIEQDHKTCKPEGRSNDFISLTSLDVSELIMMGVC